ncbi:arginase-1-like isoform X1 [Mytilus californianus]|uniref:arginase-1-like isoform X1 n=2 Tax=Mytilus californianus TaxID=6549 RepID=UPI002245E8B7|nr:arginase-1-like isoform X1 [Mytilus californianus]
MKKFPIHFKVRPSKVFVKSIVKITVVCFRKLLFSVLPLNVITRRLSSNSKLWKTKLKSNMPTDDKVAKIGLFGVPFSKGQQRDGTEKGPGALRKGGLLKTLTSIGHDVLDYGDLPLDFSDDKEGQTGVAKNPKTVGHASKMIADKVSEVVKSGRTCLALGGDHSMAIGTIYGQHQVQPDQVVLWIDAHADINTPLTSGSGNMHGMPLSFLVKELDPYLPKIPGFEFVKPCLTAKDIAYIGLRDVDPGERYIIEKLGITAFSMQEVDKYGINEVMTRALKAIDPEGKRPIHLSFDVDSLDPSLAPSTGTPVLGGLSLREGLYIAEEVADTGRLSVIDVAEVNPSLGSEQDVETTVRNTIEFITKCFGNRRQGAYPPGYHIPLPT